MNSIQHTPGPWQQDWHYIVASDPAGIHPDIYLAEIAGEDSDGRIASPEQQEANGRLIVAAPDLLAACQMIIARWERGDLAEAARACQTAVESAIGDGISSDLSPAKQPSRFEFGHDPLENPDRAYVLVDGRFDVAVLRTSERIVIDVYPKDWIDPIDSLTVWDEEVTDAAAEAETKETVEA